MSFSLGDLQREAAATGFSVDLLEKTGRLLGLLDAIRSHPFLGPRVALKGGTALNLFVFDAPRLSVDIDLNYVGAFSPAYAKVMLAERPQVDQAVQAVCGREGLAVRRVPDEHAGGKWRLSYASGAGGSGNLELDMNFLLRTPLWPTTLLDSRAGGSLRALQVPVLDIHELAAGKLAALLSRSTSRDLFDACYLLRRDDLERGRLRLAFVVYGAASRKDWRLVSVDDVGIDVRELRRRLLPTLRSVAVPASGAATERWLNELVAECRDRLSAVLPLTAEEREFVGRLNERGEIAPELLGVDFPMNELIGAHPALAWKALERATASRVRYMTTFSRRPRRCARRRVARAPGAAQRSLKGAWPGRRLFQCRKVARGAVEQGHELRPLVGGQGEPRLIGKDLLGRA